MEYDKGKNTSQNLQENSVDTLYKTSGLYDV
uniref:Uncharacterized protein n=1 Tax=Anguilla anguilla TaxID=7936 RepID=A0A0E9UFK7_ANGAN